MNHTKLSVRRFLPFFLSLCLLLLCCAGCSSNGKKESDTAPGTLPGGLFPGGWVPDTASAAAATSTTGVYYVVISAPSGAEAYFDGNFVGVAPCRCTKKQGTHLITIRKSGYVTRSYTVQIDDEKEDIVYSFPDLNATE